MDTPPDHAAPEPEPERSASRRRWPLGALTLLVVGIVAGGVWLFGGDAEPELTVPDLGETLGLPTRNGEAAADFALDLIGGPEFRLSQHLAEDGRPVVLNLWASWCGPCRAEMPAFDMVSKERTDVFFLGVAVDDDPAAALQFAEEIAVSYALAIDEADRVGRRYSTPGLPATFFISSDGVVVRTVFGQIEETQLDDLIDESFGG